MAKIKTFELDRWSEPDEKRRVRHIGMADAKETFDRLQTHLELKGLLPDEYFLFSDELTGELPEFDQALCIPNFGASEGIYHSLIPGAAEGFGLQCESINTDDPQAVVDALASGKLIVALMSKGHFTSSGHFMVLRGVTSEGKILVADPASKKRSEQEWDISIILDEARKGAAAGGPLWAIY